MSNITDAIGQIKGLRHAKPCSDEQIKEAERELGLTFPDEYIDYVKSYGCIIFNSVEWTGLGVKGRLNTVDATKELKGVTKNYPDGYFVLQDTTIDARYIVVNSKGEVYTLQYDSLSPLCGSIQEYLKICNQGNN